MAEELTSLDSVPRRLAEFINSWPLYSPFRLTFVPMLTVNSPPLPDRLLRFCTECNATPTWTRRSVQDPRVSADPLYLGVGSVTCYLCTHCSKAQMRLWVSVGTKPSPGGVEAAISIGEAVYRKLGQWPPQSVEPSPEVEHSLTPAGVDLYRKGLTSLAHGFGVGSLGYFRRVVEDSTSEVLKLFVSAAEQEGDAGTADKLRAAAASHTADERLRLAADALPESLRPGGVNPLAALYSHFSQGLHGGSDEDCLVVAQHLQFCLDYIFRNWKLQMDEAAKFRAQIQKWSNPSARPGQ